MLPTAQQRSQSPLCPEGQWVNLRIVQDRAMLVIAVSSRALNQYPHCTGQCRVNLQTAQDIAIVQSLHCPGPRRVSLRTGLDNAESIWRAQDKLCILHNCTKSISALSRTSVESVSALLRRAWVNFCALQDNTESISAWSQTTSSQSPHSSGQHHVNLRTVQSTESISAHYRTAPSQSLHCPGQRRVNLPQCSGQHHVKLRIVQESTKSISTLSRALGQFLHITGQRRVNLYIVPNSVK